MSKKYIITATGTDIGKTIASAMLTLALDGCYWKPVQAGTDQPTDTQIIQHLTGFSDDRSLPEAYRLKQALSPHRAAECENITLDCEKLSILPLCERTLIIEGAGGLMVPLTREVLQIDLFKRWDIPLILCARTELGTINHTLLSLEALRQRDMYLHGIIFVGENNTDNMKTIAAFSGAKILGHMPVLTTLNKAVLQKTFDDHFRREDF